MITKPSEQIAMEIAKRLTAMRLSRAWTRQTLAEKADVNVHTLKRFERTGQISFERLISLCHVLDVASEVERLFKPRQRVDVENWKIANQPTRKRGRRRNATITG